MDSETLILLDSLFERAATRVRTEGFAKESVTLEKPNRECIRRAGEMLVERAAEQLPGFDAHVSSSPDGTVTLVLDGRHRQ